MKYTVATLLLALAACASALPSDRTLAKPVEFTGVLGFLNPRLLRGQTPLIVGGSAASKGEFPHQISLQVNSGGGWYHSCGGSIVGPSKIVTAAHCIYGQSASSLRVVAGDHDLGTNEGTEQVRNVASMVRHPSYNPNTIDYDYAVIRLSSPLSYTTHIQAIALAAAGSTPSGTCVNSGWGNTRGDGSVSNPAILQKVSLPYVARPTCASAYSGVNTVTERMICAGAAGKGPCNGDSGGPLVNGGVLVGIVSWGMQPCAQSRYPGVFANVAAARSWLDAQ